MVIFIENLYYNYYLLHLKYLALSLVVDVGFENVVGADVVLVNVGA